MARSENSARLKCHRQTHTTNFLHFTCRAKPCVSLQSAPLLHHGSSSLRGCRRWCRAAAVRLPPCPTQSSCRWQCHCNANIGIETFFSTEATDSLSLYPPKSSGTYRDGGIFPYQMFAGKYLLCQKKCANLSEWLNERKCNFAISWVSGKQSRGKFSFPGEWTGSKPQLNFACSDQVQ